MDRCECCETNNNNEYAEGATKELLAGTEVWEMICSLCKPEAYEEKSISSSYLPKFFHPTV